MKYTSIEALLDQMKQMPVAERKKYLLLDPKRADIILAGTAILKTCMKLGNRKEVTVRDRGLRFGIALTEMAKTSP